MNAFAICIFVCPPLPMENAAHISLPKDIAIVALTPSAEIFGSEQFEWELVRPYGLLNHCLKCSPKQPLTCGKILAHAKAQITAFRENKGVRVCVFKIGVTSNPPHRFVSYLEKGFDTMWVVSKSYSVDLIHMLEAACISHFSCHVGCRNQHESGGEGALNRANPPMGPFFLYVTGGRADQPRRIG